MTNKTLARATNPKTGDKYALVANRDASFTVFKLCANYSHGFMRKTWRTVGTMADQRLDYATALKTFNRRAGRKPAA